MMYACSAIHLGPMPRFVFKFIRISVDGENIENDTKTIVWIENSVFKFIRISVDGALVHIFRTLVVHKTQ